MAKRRKKSKGKLFVALAIIIVIIIAVMAVLYFFKPEVYDGIFDAFHNEISQENTSDDGGSTSSSNDSTPDDSTNSNTELAAGAQEDIESADLSIHFLELGNKYIGDCTLIKCGDTEVLIDAGSRQNSATTLKSYIDQYCTDGVLEYVIATHSDQDHIAGFYGNSSGDTRTGILYQYEIETLIKYDIRSTSSGIATNFEETVESLSANGTTVYTASQCYDEKDGAKRQYFLDEEQTISINILYSYYYYNESDDNNNHSVVMLLTQKTSDGNLNYLFTGDLEEDGESKLVDYYVDTTNSKTEYDILPHVELFKGGHHGSSTSTTDKLLAVITPDNIAICTCVGSTEYGKTNDAHFPTQKFISRICNYTVNIYCTTLYDTESEIGYTSMNGNIVFYYSKAEGEDAASLKLWCSNNTTKLKDTEWFAANRTWG